MSTQAVFAAALLDAQAPCPVGLTSWNGADPAKRFAVYRNNVVVSLVNALADSFAVVQALVGEEFFRAMARLFVQSAPPRSPLLAYYGQAFPDFIAGFAPAQSVPYLADVARLEMARIRAYHAADVLPLSADVLSSFLADPEALTRLRLTLHPSVQLIQSDWAVVSIWVAHQTDDDMAANLSQVEVHAAQDALVLRCALDVNVLDLPPGAAAFIHELAQGGSLGQSAALALSADERFDLAQALALLLRYDAVTEAFIE